MSQLIADRYAPLRPLHEALAPGQRLEVRDTLSGLEAELRVAATPEQAAEHWLVQVRASALARLRHPGLDAIEDTAVLADGSLAVVSAPRKGRPAAAVCPLPAAVAPGVFLGLCRALKALHSRGFAHGALAVEHVSLDDQGRAHLAHGPSLGLGARPEDDLAPLGRLFFHLLTGRAPAEGEVLPSRAAHNVSPLEDAVVQRLLTGACESIDDVFLLLPMTEAETVPWPLGQAALVGRDAPLGALAATWSTVSASRRGRLTALTGEAGLGKSRLLDEAALGLRLSGASVLVGRASADGTPYKAWADVLRQAMPLARKRAPEAFAATAPVLSALLGDLGVPAAAALEPRQEKARLQGAIADLLAALASQGLVVMLDAWQHADALSQEALAFVARAREDRPFWLVVAGEVADADEAIALTPLGADALSDLARDLLGGRPLAPDALDGLAAVSHGNPRLATERLEALAQAGALKPSPAGWAVAGDAHARVFSLDDLYRSRLQALDATAQDAARLAAVLGAEGDLASLKALWPHGDEALSAGLAALGAEAIVRTAGAYFRFESPRWVAILEADAGPEAWKALHDRAADAFAAMPTSPETVLRRAAHALAGGRPALAVEAALEAGRTQLAFNAPAAARRFLERGLALWEQFGGSAEQESSYRRLLGDVLRQGGEYAASIVQYERAVELAADRPADRAFMLVSIGKSLQMSNQYPEAEASYQAALDLYATLDVPAGKLRGLTSLARTQLIVGNRARSEALYVQAMTEAEAIGDGPSLGESLGALGLMIVSNEPARIQEGIAYLERSVAIRKAMGDKIGLTDSYSMLGNAHITLGRLPEAKEAFTRNQRLCFECGLADEELFALINLSIVALEMGEFRRARDLALSAKARADQSGSKFPYGLAIALEALSRAYLADLADVTPLLTEATDLARELKNKYLEINILVWQAEALLVLGRLTEAVEVAHAATGLMEELGYREFEPRLLVFQAEVHGRLAEREEAHALLARAHALATENENAGMIARVLKTLAWQHLQEKNLLLARDHARQALDVAEGIGARYLAGEAHWLIGEVDLAAGQPEQASRELAKALAAGDETESPHLQCLALFCLARASDDELRTREYLFQARDMLKAQLAQLDDLDREDYLAIAERWRVDRGELVFAEKARAQSGQGELGAEGRLYFDQLRRFSAFAAALHGLDLEGALAELLELLEAQRVGLLADGHEGRKLTRRVRGGESDSAEAGGHGVSTAQADRRVLDTLLGATDVYYQPFVSEDPRFAGLYDGLSSSILAAPFPHGAVMAVRPGAPFSTQEVELMRMVGAQFGVAIVNANRMGLELV